MSLHRIGDLPRRLTESARAGRLSSHEAFVDPLRGTQRASIVLGSGRSGTTKLAELLASANGVRLIREPLHTFYSPVVPSTFVWGEYVAPGERQEELRAVWSDCLTGRARNGWLDGLNRARVARRRVVKSVAGTNLAGWLKSEFPDVGIVYIVRHPFAVATSVASLHRSERRDGRRHKWDHLVSRVVDDLVTRSTLLEGPLASRADDIRSLWHSAQEPFDRVVLSWCLENVITLAAPPEGVRVVFYEQLFTDPATELDALADHLDVTLAPNVLDLVHEPSETDFRRTGASDRRAKARIEDWMSDLEPERAAAGLAILEQFGLEHLYGEGPGPLQPATSSAS